MGESRTRLIVLTLLLVAVVTAFISVNGAVAALVPVAAVTAVRLGRSPSQLLLPLAFGAHAGSLLALTGTPVNILASNASHDAGAGGFNFFAFASSACRSSPGRSRSSCCFGERLLPDRPARRLSADFSRHAQTLAEQYSLGVETVRKLAAAGRAAAGRADALTRASRVAEVVIPPRSELVGETVFPGMVTPSGDLVVLAVQRRGEDVGPGEIELATGDTLLLQGSWSALDVQLDDPDVLVVDAPGRRAPPGPAARLPRQGGDRDPRRRWSCCSRPGSIPAAAAGLLAAGAIIVLRVLTVEQAYRAISWTTVILVGAMISLSTAMTQTGAAADLADDLVSIVGDNGGYALLLGLFVLTAVLGQLISNMATALIVIPIAISAASEIGVVAAARADVRDGRRRGGVPHAGGDAGEPDGDGPGRLPLRRLLEARPAAARALRRGRDPARSRVLVVLMEERYVSTGTLPETGRVEELVADAYERFRGDGEGARLRRLPGARAAGARPLRRVRRRTPPAASSRSATPRSSSRS